MKLTSNEEETNFKSKLVSSKSFRSCLDEVGGKFKSSRFGPDGLLFTWSLCSDRDAKVEELHF